MKIRNEKISAADSAKRRRLLRLFGTAAALLPITAITGCSDDTPAPPSPAPARDSGSPGPSRMQAAQQTAQEPEPEPEPAPAPEPEPEPAATETADAAPGELQPVDLDDPTAQALGYRHDADNVDPRKYPDRDPAHRCSNCILYTGQPGAEWGPCSLFPGRGVNANGWCSSYTPKPS